MASSPFIVSALKHRPTTFGEVLAQEHIVQTLQHSLERNRLANAYLFAGSRGTGKTTTARIFAKALNCTERQSNEPCNRCDSCAAINRGNHPDVIEIDAASNRGISEIKQLREDARFAPTLSAYKVFVIDESHMLTNEANNALLKTLEEPPAHCKFVFATTELHKVPNTILSRCQRFQFRRIPVSVIEAHLRSILTQQSELQLPEREGELDAILFLIARAAEGVLRDALVLLDQTLAFCSNPPQLAEVQQVLGVIEHDRLDQFTQALLQDDPATLLQVIENVAMQGRDMKRFLGECLHHLRTLAVCKANPESDHLADLPEEMRANLMTRASETTLEQILYITDQLWEAERRLAFSADARLVVEMSAIKAAKAAQAVRIEDLLEKLKGMPGAPSPPAAPAATPPPAPQSSPSTEGAPDVPPQPSASQAGATEPSSSQASSTPAVSAPPAVLPAQGSDSLSTSWSHFLAGLENDSRFTLLAGTLQHSQLVEMSDSQVRLRLPADDSYGRQLLENRMRPNLLKALENAFGKPLDVVIEMSDAPAPSRAPEPGIEASAPSAAPAAVSPPNRREQMEKLQQHPAMSRLMDELEGHIQTIRPFAPKEQPSH